MTVSSAATLMERAIIYFIIILYYVISSNTSNNTCSSYVTLICGAFSEMDFSWVMCEKQYEAFSL